MPGTKVVLLNRLCQAEGDYSHFYKPRIFQNKEFSLFTTVDLDISGTLIRQTRGLAQQYIPIVLMGIMNASSSYEYKRHPELKPDSILRTECKKLPPQF